MARRTRRPAMRPLPGRDLTWPGTALPVREVDPAVDAAKLAEALAASGYRPYRVGVYWCADYPLGARHVGFTGARLLDTLRGHCAHDVTAKSRAIALRLAVQEHKERCAR